MSSDFVEWMFARLWYYTVLTFQLFVFVLRLIALTVSAILNRRPLDLPNGQTSLMARSRQQRRRSR